MELGARFEPPEQLRVLAHLGFRSERVTLCRLSFQRGLGRHARFAPFYYCERVRPFWSLVREWMTHIDPKQLVLLDVGYVVDNVDPPWKGEKRVVFLAIPAVAWMVIRETRKRIVWRCKLFLCDLILFFRHHLRVKIRSENKRLGRITFDRRWRHAASLVVQKGATLESSFPPFFAHGCDGPGHSGPHPG